MTDRFQVELSKDDLLLICNVLNDVLHGPDSISHPGEFSARIGRSKEEGEELHRRLAPLAKPGQNNSTP